MISGATVPFAGARLGEETIMNITPKARSVILYGSSIALGLILCKAWLFAQSLI